MSSHELQVLAGMLVSKAAVEDATEILTGADLADYRHEIVFDAIAHLDADGHPVDPLSVHDHLTATGLGAKVSLAYLHEIINELVSPSSTGYHAQHVKADSIRSRVRKVGEQVTALGVLEDPLEAVNAARALLDGAVDEQPSGVPNEQAVYEAIDSLDAPLGIPTPWSDLSGLIQGWAPGMLYVAGARPGVGKTVLGTGALLDAAYRTKGAVVMVSLEMPRNELYLRMLSNVGEVNGDRLTHRKTTPADDEKLSTAAARIAGLPLVVDDRSAMSLAQVRALVRAEQRKREVSLVVVDYLGLVKPPADAPKHDRRVQVDAIAQGLKNLARDLRVPIIALAQLNRGIEGRADKVPTLADLRESGGIEAAADCVLLMHRTEEAPNDLLVTVAKNRHGPRGHFTLNFRGEFSRIEDLYPNRLGAAS